MLILASSSPRRRELLSRVGADFTVIPAMTDEGGVETLSPARAVETLAERKALAVFITHPGDVVIGADTVVSLDGKIFGKPADASAARKMLSALSGRSHEVVSGVCVIASGRRNVFSVRTAVRFRRLSPALIERYLATGEPFDKAGAYGIQGFGALLVEGIEGDYCNVVGLPLSALARVLEEDFGIALL